MSMIAAMKSPILSCAIILTLALGALNAVYADSATWSMTPISNDWNTAENWTPNTVPNGPDDVATFGLSHHTGVFVSTNTEVNQLIFSSGASPFTINAAVDQELTVSGIGVINNSGIAQTFVFPNFAGIVLTNNATVGDMTFFTLKGGHGQKNNGGFASFSGNASAGNGTFVLEPIETPDANFGGVVSFGGNSSAGNGTFTLQITSFLNFEGNASAANGTFIVDGGLIELGLLSTDTATAGNGLFIINSGGVTFIDGSSAGNATLIANPGSNGGEGGRISFENGAHDGGEARMELFGNGTLDIQFIFGEFVSVGSIEGNGIVFLGERQLITGSNDLSTTFSGTIQDSADPRFPGSLQKIGNGTLTLSGQNTYTGDTTVKGGKLVIANQSGSGTGSGAVSVTRGKLGGTGIIAGATTIGTGGGTGAFLAPAAAAATSQPATLTIQSGLTFNADATYTCTFKAEQSRHGTRTKTTMVIANEVTINSGAMIELIGHVTGSLSQGTVLTLISNTSADPIIGTFSNLPDGSIVTINGNNFQASYEGGDGNDLTLTVVP
jgi:autotransporter-associated beta strand protein